MYNFLNTGSQFRSRIAKEMKPQFNTVSDAMAALGLAQGPTEPEEPLPDISQLSTESRIKLALKALAGIAADKLASFVTQLVTAQQNIINMEAIADAAFFQLAVIKGITSYPSDFASMSSKAMHRLQSLNKPNVLLNFAYCLGKERPGTQDPLMPINRMPFGLIQYQIEFFSRVTTCKVVSIPI